MSHDVAILIVSYNSARQIAPCLRSVQQQRKSVNQQIIVLDNASWDETADLIRREFPDVLLLTPGRNLGFAAGVNEAVRHADAEFVLLLNPDTEIREHAIDEIVNFARLHPEHGFYGGRTVQPNGRLEPSSCWGAPTLASMALFAFGLTALAPRNRWLDPESLGDWARDTVREVGVITGCFLLARRDAWEQIGGFDERYFMYMEDVDLGDRLGRAGWQNIYVPSAEILHDKGHATGRDPARNLAAHHTSTYTFLSDRHPKLWQAPLRWTIRGALAARAGLVVHNSRRKQRKGRQ